MRTISGLRRGLDHAFGGARASGGALVGLLGAALLVGGCGSPGPGPASPASPGSPSGTRSSGSSASSSAHAVPANLTPETLCARLGAVATRCPSIGNGRVDQAQCVESFRGVFADPAGRELAKNTSRCLFELDDCEPIYDCLHAAVDSPRSGNDRLRECHETGRSGDPVGIPEREWQHRNGADVTRVSEAKSTKALPIEMCGIAAANTWLTSLRCDDGSQPLKDRADAEHARAGNVGKGGRCESIIDRYAVVCGGTSHEIFIDAYVCPVEMR